MSLDIGSDPQGSAASWRARLRRLGLTQRTVQRAAFDAPRSAGSGQIGFRVTGPGFATAPTSRSRAG